MKILRRFFFYFPYFGSKHRLWVHVRTASPRREAVSNEYPQSMFWSKKGKLGIPLQTPVFPLYKSGVQGSLLFMDMLS